MATRNQHSIPTQTETHSFHGAEMTTLWLQVISPLHPPKKEAGLTISSCTLPSAPDMKPQTGIWKHASPHAAVFSKQRPWFCLKGDFFRTPIHLSRPALPSSDSLCSLCRFTLSFTCMSAYPSHIHSSVNISLEAQ